MPSRPTARACIWFIKGRDERRRWKKKKKKKKKKKALLTRD
jgi:hypothetical protein